MFHSLLYVLVKHWHQLYALFQLIVTSWVRRFLQDLQDRLAFWATRWSTSCWPHCIPGASLFSMLRIWHKSWRWKRGVARSPSELSTQPAMGPRHVSTSTLEDGRVSELWSWWWNISCCFLFNMKYKQLVFFFPFFSTSDLSPVRNLWVSSFFPVKKSLLVQWKSSWDLTSDPQLSHLVMWHYENQPSTKRLAMVDASANASFVIEGGVVWLVWSKT